MEHIRDTCFYHICKYREYDLEIGKENSTDVIDRTWGSAPSTKQHLEFQLEKYRLKKCPELPSRKKCFYVSPKNKVEVWMKKLIGIGDIWYKIYEVSLEGSIHWADENDYSEGLNEEYWRGCSYTDDACLPEGLFVGKYIAMKDVTSGFERP